MTLRLAALALAIPLALPAAAQMPVGPIGSGLRFLQDRGLLPSKEQGNPTQPSSNPVPPVKRTGDLPQPEEVGPQAGGLDVKHAGATRRQGSKVFLTGGLEFTDRGYHVWADEAEGDQITNIWTLKGNVIVVGAEESIYGELVTVDFNNRTFIAEDAESTLKPTLVRGRIRDNLYVRAKKSNGSEREVWGEGTTATTCSYPDPHYEIVADRTDVRPGRRVIFRRVKLRLLGHTLVTLPFLSIPLDQRTYNNLPQVGQGQQEGYFIKNRFGVPLRGDDVLNTRFDYYTKLGTGLGGDYQYQNTNVRGLFRAFTIVGQHNQLELVNQHRQELGWATLNLDNSFQRNNYLIQSNSTIWNSRAQLLIPQGRSTSRISFLRNSNEGSGFDSLQQTLGLNDTRFWNRRLQTSLDINMAKSASTFTGGQDVRRQQVDIRFNGISDLGKAQARLDYIRSIPVGESTNFFGLSDITPAFTLTTDARRMFGQGFDARFPFRSELAIGEYGDPISRGRITRSNFAFDFNNPRAKPSRLQVSYQAGFRQSVYSDDTAQYVLRAATQIGYQIGAKSAFNIRYNYLRPYGYSPLQIDRTGRSNVVTTDLSLTPLRNLSIGAQTGYDFNVLKQGNQTAWQQVGLRAQYTLGRWFDFRALSTYDTTRHAYSSTRLDLVYIPGSTFISVGAKYDGIRSKWAALNLFVDGFQVGRLRTSMLLNYNGYLKKVEAQHFSFTYDLHCAEAVLQIIDNPVGYRSGRQFLFFVRIKAFPFDTPFGTGQQGQPIGTGTGRDF